MYKDVVGKNILTVLVSKPPIEETIRLRMFFCPYNQNQITRYQGLVKVIYPGFDPEDTPQFIVKSVRVSDNIQYSFKEGKEDESQTVNFWIQDQYFNDDNVRPYHCFNCQMPQLYFSGNKVVFKDTKADLKTGQSYECGNPMCRTNLTYLGIVRILEPQLVV